MSDETNKPETTSAPEKTASRSIFSYRDFNKLFVGSFFGAFADRLYFAALIAAANIIFAQSSPEDQKGKTQIIATIPLLLLYGFSGSMVDTFDRRSLLKWVKGLKAFCVLLFVPLLWAVVNLDPKNPDPGLLGVLHKNWFWCMWVVVLLNALTVPFGPARAAAIPDVTPEDQRAMAASLMATSGLMALLAASGVGGQIAGTDVLGPAITMFISSACYGISLLLFSRLPDAVAVPGNKRTPVNKDGAADAGPVKQLSLGEYARSQWQGVHYVFSRASVLGLVFFESAFWTFGSAFYILLDFHARTQFGMQGNDLTRFSGTALAVMGVGLFSGALGIGKIARKLSPILSYAPAFLMLGLSLYFIFRSTAGEGGGPPGWLYPCLFMLGLSGGVLLGRVDADVLEIVEPQIRGRVFSLKALAFAITIMATLYYISLGNLTDDEKRSLAVWMPRAFLLLAPLAAFFSWTVDVAIWRDKLDTDGGNPMTRFGYWLVRMSSTLLMKIWFRYEVRGAEKIPQTGPVVLAANHASFLDPLILGCATTRPVQYIMYSSYYRSIAHPIFRLLRCIPVDEKSASAAMKAGIRSLRKGVCVGIFPEGQVSKDGQLQPPMGGALFMAQKSGAIVVPVALKGNAAAFGRGFWFPRPSKVTVIVGEPFTLGPETSKEEMAQRTEQLMLDLAKMLELPPPAMGKSKEPPKSDA